MSDHFEGFDEKIIFHDFRAKRTGGGGLSPPHFKVPFLEKTSLKHPSFE